jgi:hypothetical protein
VTVTASRTKATTHATVAPGVMSSSSWWADGRRSVGSARAQAVAATASRTMSVTSAG